MTRNLKNLSITALVGAALLLLSGLARAQTDMTSPVAAFRAEMIDFFATFGLVPVIATRDFMIGDVVQADGIDFLARGTTCFPGLTVPAPTPQDLPGSVQTKAIGLDAGLSLRRVFAVDAQANLLHHADISFSDVTSAETDLKSLRMALNRKACPEIAPLVDGTSTALEKGREPSFVVSAVYFGRPRATVEVVDKAKIEAEVARIAQIGQGQFSVTAGVGNTVILKSDRRVPIALRPVTIPDVIRIDQFALRGDESLQLQWKSAACTPGTSCRRIFGPFADVIKAWVPNPQKLQ